MPLYQFECPQCKLLWDTFFSMDATKKSNCPSCNKAGNRVFSKPNMGVDVKISPWDIKKQVKKTGDAKGGRIGDLWNMAAEMSERRGGENDPIRKKAEANYAKERKGKKYRKPGGTVDISFNT